MSRAWRIFLGGLLLLLSMGLTNCQAVFAASPASSPATQRGSGDGAALP